MCPLFNETLTKERAKQLEVGHGERSFLSSQVGTSKCLLKGGFSFVSFIQSIFNLSEVLLYSLQALSDTYDLGHKHNLKKSASTEPIASRQVAVLM